MGCGSLLHSRPPTMSWLWPAPQGSAWGGQGLFIQTTDLYSLPWLPLTAPGVPSWCEGEWGSFPLLQAPEPTWFECLEPLQRSRGECPWVQQCVWGGGAGELYQFVFALRCVSVAEKRGPETLELRGVLLPTRWRLRSHRGPRVPVTFASSVSDVWYPLTVRVCPVISSSLVSGKGNIG